VIHATEIDAQGNVRVAGTHHWDRIMSRAAKSVLVVAEKLVDTEVFTAQPESTLVPHFMVQAFAIVPRGAWPGSCWPLYEIDYPAVEAYLPQGDAALAAHLAKAPEAEAAHV
jgi:glutaconate CoA-transferase subunit A